MLIVFWIFCTICQSVDFYTLRYIQFSCYLLSNNLKERRIEN